MTVKPKIKMTVNRANFMAWVDGDLLIRDASGKCIIGDDVAHERAEKIMDEGGTIGLTDSNGIIISMMSVVNKCYEEQLIN